MYWCFMRGKRVFIKFYVVMRDLYVWNLSDI